MATHERAMSGSADALVAHLDAGIVGGSVSASVEGHSDARIGMARMLVRTYERYSYAGRNRVSLHVAILAVGTELAVAATTAGGSQAVFWKLNTYGEDKFLDKAIEALDSFT